MAKHNMAFLYGRVSKAPIINMNRETGDYYYGMVYLDTIRGTRPIDDGVKFAKHDHPLIMSRDKVFIDMMRNWKENDIIFVKGVVTSKALVKSSFCPECKDSEGKSTRNEVKSNLIYITPIYMKKVAEYDNKNDATDDLMENREISNQVWTIGTLIKDPRFFKTKDNIPITQYLIALNRKFRNPNDSEEIVTDWPIVKSYGEMALEDKVRLHQGSEIYIDGFLQARTVRRKIKCKCCGQLYEFKDHAMEIVPYAIEYLTGFVSNQEIEEERKTTIEQIKQSIFDKKESMSEAEKEIMTSDDVKTEEE